MKQQTSIEWLIEKLDSNLDINHSWRTRQYIEQAKEMEKQQIIDFGNKCIHKWKFGDVELGKNFAEQLYNETYGNKGSDEVEKSEKPINLTYSQTEISETEEYTSCPICNGTSINGFCSTPNCAYSLYEPNKDYLEMTPISSQTEISEIEKESYIKFPILTYSVMEGHDDFNRVMRDSWVEGIKWYREQLKKKQ